MPHYKLTYFDFDGGRAEPIRIAFHAGGIAFEDHRLSFPEFGALRDKLRFKAVPVLEIDGSIVTQSNAMCRHVGRLSGLYPEDAMQALYCDEVLDAVEDISHHMGATFGLKDEALKIAREQLVKGPLSTFIKGADELLARGGGSYFADGRMTVADLKVFVQTRWLARGTLDHVPTDLVDRLAPALAEHQDRIAKDPRVVAYYAR
ncbi:MAG: glutathione S-transferase family protein [Rhizobacter sp.]|nr:glutathione S-transferase family protein [Burkholderiaceae bacterium]MCO5123593.1 glutathione S-transferase family protein [Rhizobacter sp.]